MDTIRRPEQPLSSPGFPYDVSPRRPTLHRLWTSLLWSSLATMSWALEVGAQDGALRGIVNTAEKKPLPQARVSVVGTPLFTVSDTDGTFRLAALPSGSQTVEVRMFGYGPSLFPVEIIAGKTALLEVTLSPVAALLETVNVMADTMIAPGMKGFQERKARGTGKFFTREDIERMQARLFTDVLRRVPGMQIQRVGSNYGAGYSVQSGRTQSINGGRPCPVLFYINGAPFPLLGDVPINNFISPEDVAAVEVYTGASQLPPQFNSTMYNSRCGVVVIWTRTSNDPTRAR